MRTYLPDQQALGSTLGRAAVTRLTALDVSLCSCRSDASVCLSYPEARPFCLFVCLFVCPALTEYQQVLHSSQLCGSVTTAVEKGPGSTAPQWSLEFVKSWQMVLSNPEMENC